MERIRNLIRRGNVFYRVLKILNLEILELAVFPWAIRRFKSINTRNIEDLIDIAFNSYGGMIAPDQDKTEIAELLRIVASRKPGTVIEIGTFNGGTLFLLAHVIADDATIISIDLPRGKFGGGYPECKVPLIQSFKLPGQKMHLIRSDSHNPETLSNIMGLLGEKKIDLLFIDGDHSYEGVKRDFEMYRRFVSPGGIIALHDVAAHPVVRVCEVYKFWHELRESDLRTVEIITDKSQGWAGIGLVYND